MIPSVRGIRSGVFLSTPSARRATPYVDVVDARHLFLSTPSARRATFPASLLFLRRKYFYPRPPRGGRRDVQRHIVVLGQFLSTPSARRATPVQVSGAALVLLFLSTPSARRAT